MSSCNTPAYAQRKLCMYMHDDAGRFELIQTIKKYIKYNHMLFFI